MAALRPPQPRAEGGCAAAPNGSGAAVTAARSRTESRHCASRRPQLRGAMSRLSPQEENLQGKGRGAGGLWSFSTQAILWFYEVKQSHEGLTELLLTCSSLCSSPPRSQTPLDSHRALEIESHSSGEKNSFQSEEDFLERRKEVERLLKKNADWIWDWSSRPENIPPKEFLFKHPRRTATLSMRNTSVMKKGGIFSAEFLKVFLPSLLLSHLLAIGLGIYIGRRLTTTASSSSF
uniref:BCL2 interacting protein 3 n=1 Tax=Pavo cristatus TaxID=9049 RepID=A0A8C9FUH8_PAVCR